MPFCPNCKYEYEKNIENCSDCGAKLVDELEKEPEAKPYEEYDKEVFLTSAANDVQASIIISKLSAFGIPVMKKYRDEGSAIIVFTGTSLFGVDLYVPSRQLSTAKEILNDNVPIDSDSLEFDKMMGEYGFDDIDNLEFENEDDVKEEASKDIHLVNKEENSYIASSPSEYSEKRNFGSDGYNSINSDDMAAAQKKRDKKIGIIRITIFILFIVPLVISLIRALVVGLLNI